MSLPEAHSSGIGLPFPTTVYAKSSAPGVGPADRSIGQTVPMPRTPLRELNWRLIVASVLVVTVSTFPTFIVAAAIGQAGPELGYGTQTLGLLTALFFLVASASSAMVGRLVERVGWRITMRVNATASAAILLLLSTAVTNLSGLTLTLTIAAVFYGAANPAANLALARVVPAGRRGLVFGIKHAGIPFATLLAGVAVPSVVLTLGWRWAPGIGAILALVVVFLVPKESQGLTDQPALRPADSVRRMSPQWLALLSLASAFATVAATALSTFQVDAATRVGFDEAAAGTLLALGSLASIGARTAYGYMADRTGTDGFGWIATLTAVGAGAFVLMGLVTGGQFAAVTVLAFVTGWGWPGLLTFSVVTANEGRPAGSTAITQAGVFVGAGLGPSGVGWLAEHVSFQAAWVAVAVSLSIAATLMTIVRLRGVPGRPLAARAT